MKILIVRLRLIGDVVFTTPLVGALRRQYPDAQISYLVETAAAPIVAHHPDLSEVIVIEHRRGVARIADDLTLAARLRRARFDLVLDLHGGPRSAWLTWASGAPRRIGYDIEGRAWMYTTCVHRPRGLHPRHSVENQWDLLPAVDKAFSISPERDLNPVVMHTTDDARHAVATKLARWAIPATASQVVVLHVSAGNPFRRWPEQAFADVAARLVRQSPNRWVLLTAGPSDWDAVDRVRAAVIEQVKDDGRRVIDTGDLSLLELRALLERAALYIGGDSGPLHIAATSEVPIVAIFGPTLAERSAPWRPAKYSTVAVDVGALPCRPCDQRVCAPGDFRCLTHVAASDVLRAAEGLLGRAG